jgi:hypothetical protein
MIKRLSHAIGYLTAILIVLIANMKAQDQHPGPYPNMASLDQYLMADRDAEIALARSAAPEAISRDAKVLILVRHGYETAVEGKNGWVCLVERGWTAPFDAPEFWNPKIRGAMCFNPPAVKFVLPATYKRTEMVLAGLSKAEITKRLIAAYARKELPAFEPGGISYMMSKQAYLTDEGDHILAHLMFYVPPATDWGADLPNSPVMLGIKSSAAIPFTEFLVPVAKWSDGTAAPLQ